MADQTITAEDIAALASKLDEMAAVLTDTEKALLLGIFKLAGQALSSHMSSVTGSGQQESGRLGAPASGVGSLSAGFKGAFQQLGAANLSVRTGLGAVASGVGIGVVW
ncbi:hypothetical protein K9U39_15145 [Rhodoblastus acidophilus]|uniref:Phage tail tape measure protein n=1 Tax=Candidatus Rhodoblastus alkanivorans TaxID=2954117 RepID=A0ABS9Z0Q8_9HYPH|nr:hypothetical protein [Candidatus Rhodoblastus alkanivorans]MCI4678168.1 hypothetical protein [Candidatus Rhodoblastus alkanivorans]MCI4681218.1 hypothetical protein [Candidatus Rhodoblastus alkanivorans]MDI4642261.1 hypothetical protein [Rhodoblastus acidophilus]